MPNVCTHAVCGVYVKIFPSNVLYLYSNVFGFFTFVAILMVFRATCSVRFLVCASIVLSIPFYLTLSLFFHSSITLGRHLFSVVSVNFAFEDFLAFVSLSFLFLTDTSSFDHLNRSCMISAGSGGFLRFCLSKHACFAFSDFELFGVLFVAMFDKGVFGLRPMCASNGEIFVTPCGVIRNVFMISATSEASRSGVFVFINPHYR